MRRRLAALSIVLLILPGWNPALSAGERPFKATYDFVGTDAVIVDDTHILFTGVLSGHATHLGRFVGETQYLVDVTTGMFETYAAGRACDVSSACHWAVNEAASAQYGRMWGHAYSVTPGAIVVPAESPIMKPSDLAGVEVAVGYHSGSHFSALQALESFLQPDEIRLRFVGMPWDRVEALLQRTVPAANVWSTALYLLDQQGFRRVADTTFMIGFLFDNETDPEDVERYFRGLKRAQAELDLQPERYKHHHLDGIPAHLRHLADVRGFGAGERIVFLPYTREMYERSQRWMHERGLFDHERPTPAYESVVYA